MAGSERKQILQPDPLIPSDLEELIGYNLKRAYVTVQADFRETLGQDGFSARAFSAISIVVEYPNITQSAVARMLGIERSGLVAIIDGLEHLGYVHRTQVPGDRRVQALVPTPAGQRAYDDALAKVRAHERAMTRDLGAADTAALLALLRKIRKVGEEPSP